MRKFLLEKIELLKKPKTNIQILQNNVLLKFRVFMLFLKDHYIEVFIEVCNVYSEIMSRMYYTYFRAYIKDLNTLTSEVYNKTDTVVNENPQLMRSETQTRATNLKPENRSIFHLMGREQILNSEEDPVIIHVANQRNQKFTPEVAFKSVNKLLLDSVSSEYVFTMEFFSLRTEQNKVVANGIFKNTTSYVLEYTQQLFSISYDSIALLLSLALNDKNHKGFNGKGLSVLDPYFEKQQITLWARFAALFDAQVGSITNMRPDTFNQVEKVCTLKTILIRFVDLATAYYRIYSEHSENHMLRYRISQFKNQFVELLKRHAKKFQTEREKIKFMIETLDFLVEQLKQGAILEEDSRALEKDLELYKDKFVEWALKEYFEHLIDFVKKYAKEEEEIEIKRLNSSESGDSVQSASLSSKLDKNPEKKIDNKHQVNQKLIENIASDFKDSWQRKIAGFKDVCGKSFTNQKAFNAIMKSFLLNILTYYNIFYNYVKENCPSLRNSILPNYVVMKEVNAQTIRYKWRQRKMRAMYTSLLQMLCAFNSYIICGNDCVFMLVWGWGWGH